MYLYVLFFVCADDVDMCSERWGLIWRRCPNTWNNKVGTYQHEGELLSISTLPVFLSLSLSLSPPRQTLVMTTDYCELLYVEALRIRRIYEAHKGAMKDLLTPRSLSIDQDSVDSDGAETERDSITPDSDLAMAGLTLIMLIKDHFANDLIR